MNEPMNIEQIAALAHVSRSTVSRVLNNHPSVRPTVRQRVQRVIEEQGYAPRAAARSLASRRTNVAGLIIPRSAALIFSDPFFGQVIQGITEACHSRGYFLTLSMITPEMEQGFYNRILRSRHFDGVIMLSSDVDDPILPLLIKDETPLVLVGRHPYFQNIASVDVENREGARMAVSHLLALGHRRIATITGPLQMTAAVDRRDGYKQALLEAGIPIDPALIVHGDFTQEGGYLQMKAIIEQSPRPTAVFVASDYMAIGALRAIHEAGLSVPGDLAVVGFDDLPMAQFATPPLTTIRQPLYQMGATATQLLIDTLEGEQHDPAQVRLAVELVIRASSGAQGLAHRNGKEEESART